MLAYIGPGGALSAIGAALALLAAVGLALVGFVWYPLKRLLARRKAAAPPAAADNAPAARTAIDAAEGGAAR
jgi:hypothetical protein